MIVIAIGLAWILSASSPPPTTISQQPSSTPMPLVLTTSAPPVSQPTNTVAEPKQTATVQQSVSLSRAEAEIDALLGAGNWFCFPDREDGLGVKRIPPSFIVKSPLRLIVTYRGNYNVGQVVPQIGATVELEKPLLQSECPLAQLQPLADWTSARDSDLRPFDQSRMNELLGASNWRCVSEFSFAVSVNKLLSDLYVQYPVTFVTYYDSTGYGVGETVPKGQQATVWLGGSIPKNQCP